MNATTSARTPATRRPLVLASVMLAMFLTAIEATIVSTAMPSIVSDLGGFALFGWVFSGYLIFQAVTVPIYGKLADLFGRRPVMAAGMALFLAGSALCGLAWNMYALVAFRMLQGLGAGAVQPIAMTIVGDLYSLEERGKIQGYLSSVWAVSSIVGPALGGFFVEYAHWSWVFWINLPIGLLALAGIWFFLRERPAVSRPRIDFAGSALLFFAVGALMLALSVGRDAGVSSAFVPAALAAVSAVMFAGFIRRERAAPEPIMPLSLWRDRLMVVANVASFAAGVVLIGVSAYLPTYAQGVLGRSPTVAGAALTVMSIGWPLAAYIAGKNMPRLGFWKTATTGGVFLVAGALTLWLFRPQWGVVGLGAGSFLIGAGMGFATSTFVVAIQSSVGWNMRGAATALHLFMRSIGTTVGAAALGALMNWRLDARLHESFGRSAPDLSVFDRLLDPAERQTLPAEWLPLLRDALGDGIHFVFAAVLVLAVATALLTVMMPGRKTSLDRREERVAAE